MRGGTMTRGSALVLAVAVVLAVPALAGAQAADVVQYYHTDAIGSVRRVTDATGQVVGQYDYRPFGEPWNTPVTPDRRQFAGKERDRETSFDYFGARYYANATGRFTTVDPVVPMDAALRDPQLWNRYTYVRNNPLRYTDPDGRCIWDLCAAEGTGVYLAGAAAVATTAWLISPPGQEAVRQVVNDTGMIITTAAGAIGSWFQSESRSKSPAEMGEDLAKKIGGNRVPYETPTKKGNIDLAGKGHFDKTTGADVPTPHVQEYPRHVGPNGEVNVSRKGGTVRPATKQDIRIAEELARRQGRLKKDNPNEQQ